MSRFRILPYKMNSISAKSLAKFFNVLKIYHNGDFIPRDGDIILNWGSGGYIPILNRNDRNYTVLNKPEAIDNASNKISTLRLLKQNEVSHVEFKLNKEDAKEFINKGHKVYCRTRIAGKAGAGIIIANTKDELPDNCRLFTKKFPNDEEYRIHVFNNEIIDRVHKKKMSKERMQELNIKEEDLSTDIKNLKKGWSFTREDLEIDENLDNLAKNAIKALGLDFGAVDIAKSKDGNAVVLEVNTAAGMKKGTTTHLRYCNAISKYLGKDFSKEEYEERYNCKLNFGLLDK